MASKLETIIQQALRTFARANKSFPEPSQNDLTALKTLADVVTIRDVKLPKILLQKTDVCDILGKKWRPTIEPVEYLRIYEDADVSIGVFVLRQGAKLPIHDHPCMYGILKVIEGVIKVTSYSVVEMDTTISVDNSTFFYKHPLKVIKHPEAAVSEKDPSCILTPTERSIHEVECLAGPAAFLDILAPPYEEDSCSEPRGCHYFQEVVDNKNEDNYTRLIQISDPNYWAAPIDFK
ncbi:UNVERIFIED_CONTAM: hypothetical protein PYX00_000463 [Menopon gallinae]|uniref:2-aminoethanethiol dioxygenase n=1 Tax=Menopon gallinae TaxID=328185 RepID=A0AAW2I995_9NEOP